MRQTKFRYLIPNLFTGASLLLGFAAVLLSARGELELAAWMICWGALLDKLDGAAARLLDAGSAFGAEFDSFADFVVFGIAPGALIWHTSLPLCATGYLSEELLASCCGVYVTCTGVRLARFNSSTPPGGEHIFYGIPTTLAGIIISTLYLTLCAQGLEESTLQYLPGVLFCLGLLMVSPLPLPKLKVRKSKSLNLFQAFNIAGGYLCAPLQLFPEYLLGLGLIYLFVGLTWGQLSQDARSLRTGIAGSI